MHILIVSSRLKVIETVSELFSKYTQIKVSTSELGTKALEIINGETFDLVIIDEVLKDMPGIKLMEKLIYTNPLINCAAISGLPPEKFHEATEGLGILMQLPLFPQGRHIDELLTHLEKVCRLTIPLKSGQN